MLDVARWGLDLGMPQRISAHGGQFHFHDDQQTPDTLSVQYSYEDSLLVWEHRQWSNHGIEGRSAAAAFYGDQGVLVVDRGGWKVYQTADSSNGVGKHLLSDHCQDFVRCILERSAPAADMRTGHTSSTMCHLGNIAFRVGRELQWDAENERFVADADANQLLTGSFRAPWSLPHAS
jgi:predicted dehydrogenase